LLAKSRSLLTGGRLIAETPLLVPSLSSRATPNATVTELFDFVQPLIVNEILVSAFDIYHYGMPTNFDFASMVIVDSGGYEALSPSFEPTAVPASPVTQQQWNQTYYEETLSQLKFDVPTVIVSFDHAARGVSVWDQVTHAQDLFSRYPRAATTLLLKPSRPADSILDINEIITAVSTFSSFTMIGVTEKELGRSLLERLCNIARLRRAMDAVGLDMPIHVFGVLDTLQPPLYFLAGADVFDGLAWVRYAFQDGETMYISAYAARHLTPVTSDMDALCRIWSENYYELLALQEEMRTFAHTNQYSCFTHHAGFYEETICELNKILEVY